ncbi:LysM peptidoglycan-binding domain-containing protein [Parahaliea sp. F7430]|uniref:LysM peptidoglycan-binding domain-containing protein n=1 Tax=Sediminihaliea albiluteola TaxID=2758564 RepID=A0A7W2TUP0_9GAMM|nr:LysM peptidoglycan-binding domain-containing protein [Sediminihaliea albiluteola]
MPAQDKPAVGNIEGAEGSELIDSKDLVTSAIDDSETRLDLVSSSELRVVDSDLFDEQPDDLWQRLRSQLSWQDYEEKPEIVAARERFLAQSNYLDVIAARSELYLHYIVEEVEARGMPIELALLPLVESTMDPFANSPQHAAGLWQIMPATGRHLGLTNNWWYDGRRDLRDSTRVALDYLEELQASFDGDWLLALAAYNSGKGRVMRAIKSNRRRDKDTDYWSLNLPRETKNYVPKLLALASIIDKPEQYEADLPPVTNAPAFAIASTSGQIELAKAAELAGVDENLLRSLNPGQLRWATAPSQAELLVPVDSLEAFENGLANLSPSDRLQWQHYRIRQGDNLVSIARRFDTQVAMIKEVNKLRGSFIRAGDTLLIPQGSTWGAALAQSPQSHDYRVRRGDSLYRIAGRFKVSIDDIIRWNSLDPRAYLRPGQQLTLYLGRDS